MFVISEVNEGQKHFTFPSTFPLIYLITIVFPLLSFLISSITTFSSSSSLGFDPLIGVSTCMGVYLMIFE